ncbi:hypothetical protein ALFP_1197 [Alcaligenes faecalis]|nr:hypothetical protein ALFP_1197 [Alcaligenes faecalis]
MPNIESANYLVGAFFVLPEHGERCKPR